MENVIMLKKNDVFALSKRTKEIITNFANINPSMLFKAGSELKTISPNKDVLGTAEIEEGFPSQFAIYDLSRFLSILSTYDTPIIKFQDKYLTVTRQDNTRPYKYRYCEEVMICVPPKNDVKVDDPIAEFK